MPAEWRLSPNAGARSPAPSAPSLRPRRTDSCGDEPAMSTCGEFGKTPWTRAAQRTSEEADPLRRGCGSDARCERR